MINVDDRRLPSRYGPIVVHLSKSWCHEKLGREKEWVAILTQQVKRIRGDASLGRKFPIECVEPPDGGILQQTKGHKQIDRAMVYRAGIGEVVLRERFTGFGGIGQPDIGFCESLSSSD